MDGTFSKTHLAAVKNKLAKLLQAGAGGANVPAVRA
jgi:hypothetical protein